MSTVVRAIRIVGMALATVVLFVVAAAGGLLLHTPTRAAGRLITGEVNRATADVFAGTVRLVGVRRVGLGRVEGARAVVLDPEGRVVAVADGVSAGVRLPALLASLAQRNADVAVIVDDARVETLAAVLVPGPDGSPTLARAFAPRHPSPSTTAPSRGVRIDVRSFRLGTLHAAGELPSVGPVDATATDLRASFSRDARGTRGELTHASILARAVLPAPIVLRATAAAELPADGGGARTARASVAAMVGLAPLALDARLEGSHVEATADAPLVTSAAVTALGAGVALPGPAGAHVHVSGVLPLLRPELLAHVGADQAAASGSVVLGPRVRADLGARLTAAGAPVDVLVHALQSRRATTVDFDVHTVADDVSRLGARAGSHGHTASLTTRLAELHADGVHGGAELQAAGRLDLTRRHVDAGFHLGLRHLRRGAERVDTAEARGRVGGALDAPHLRATLNAGGIHAAGRAIERVAIDVSGTPRAVDVAATVQLPHAAEVHARASVAKRPGGVDVTGVELTGLGAPIRGAAHVAGESLSGTVHAPSVDLAAVARLLPEPPEVRGTGSLDATLRADALGATGHVSAAVDAVGLPRVGRASGRVALDLRGRRLDGRLEASLAGAGGRTRPSTLRASAQDVRLDGPPAEPRAWRRATGTVSVDSDLDLASLTALLGATSPVAGAAGTLSVHGRAARGAPEGSPDLSVDASTQGLAIAVRPAEHTKPSYVQAPEQAEPPLLPWTVEGVDVRLHAAIEGASDRVRVDGTLADRAGAILHARLDANPALRELVHARGDAASVLERTRFDAHVEMPPRDLASLPSALRPAAMRGLFAFAIDATGPLADPRVHAHGSARGAQPIQAPTAPRFDGDVDASYDGRAAILRALVRRPEGVVLDARADVDAPIAALLGRGGDGRSWDAGATVALHDFPLETVPQVAARGVGGTASGVVLLEGLHRDARAEADVRIVKPRLGVACFQTGQVHARIDRDRFEASTRFAGPGTLADATVRATARWGAEMVPSVDTRRPVDATLRAQDLRAAALMPFVEGAVDQLDGRLDADVRVHAEPDFKRGTVDGDVRISKATVEIGALGEPLHDVSARISMRPWGTLRVDDIAARGSTGRLTGSAQALFAGLRFESASAEIEIPRDDRMPLTVQGVSLGEAFGKVQVDARMQPAGDLLDVRVSVPELQMRLPDTSNKSVQSLEPAPHVVVGTFAPDGRFVAIPQHAPEKPREPGSLRVHAVVELGPEVRLRRGTTLDVSLAGSAVIDLDAKAHVTGTIRLVRGTVEVFGKRFTIEPTSSVSFTGETSEPQIVATAMYEAPDRTRIYADLMGTPGKMKVNLRSEPPLTQDQIVGLLLFGSDEGLMGTPAPSQQADPTQRAAGLASGVVTQGINKALSGISAVEVSTRVDTSQAANPRPEVEVRISNEVMTRLTVQTGMPAPGEPRDSTLVTVDWRFRPRWSLETTVGDAGSTFVDLLWSHRY